jgi:hypothetical protein
VACKKKKKGNPGDKHTTRIKVQGNDFGKMQSAKGEKTQKKTHAIANGD